MIKNRSSFKTKFLKYHKITEEEYQNLLDSIYFKIDDYESGPTYLHPETHPSDMITYTAPASGILSTMESNTVSAALDEINKRDVTSIINAATSGIHQDLQDNIDALTLQKIFDQTARPQTIRFVPTDRLKFTDALSATIFEVDYLGQTNIRSLTVSGQKVVESVNGQRGDVLITTTSISAEPANPSLLLHVAASGNPHNTQISDIPNLTTMLANTEASGSSALLMSEHVSAFDHTAMINHVAVSGNPHYTQITDIPNLTSTLNNKEVSGTASLLMSEHVSAYNHDDMINHIAVSGNPHNTQISDIPNLSTSLLNKEASGTASLLMSEHVSAFDHNQLHEHDNILSLNAVTGINTGDQQSLISDNLSNSVSVDDTGVSIETQSLSFTNLNDISGTENVNLHLNSLKLNATPSPSGTTDFEEGTIYYDTSNKSFTGMIDSGVRMQFGQEEFVLCYNDSVSAIPNGSMVYHKGAMGDAPIIGLARADSVLTFQTIGMTTQEIPAGGWGYVTDRGIVHDLDTSLFTTNDKLYLCPFCDGKVTNVKPNNSTQYINEIGFALLIDAVSGSIYIKQMTHAHTNKDALDHIRAGGFVNRTDSVLTISASAGAFTFNIAPTLAVVDHYEFYADTTEFRKHDLISHTVTGAVDKQLYYVWFDNSGTLVVDGAWILSPAIAPVALIYYDNGIALLFDERHSVDRNILWHSWAHNTIGARIGHGFDLVAPTIASPDTISITSGDYYDEDIKLVVPAVSASRMWYRTPGVSAMIFESIPSTTVYKLSGSKLLWDNNGTLTTANTGDYCVYWLYANNTTMASNGTTSQIYTIMGQETYATLALAQGANVPSIVGAPTPELKLLYLVIYRQTTASAYAFNSAIDKRAVSSVAGTSISSTPTAASITVVPIGDISSTNVQSALEELDNDPRINENLVTNTVTGGTVNLNFSTNRNFKIDCSTAASGSAMTIAVSAVPDGSRLLSATLIVQTGANLPTTTWPTGITYTLTASKSHWFTIASDDGTNWKLFTAGVF